MEGPEKLVEAGSAAAMLGVLGAVLRIIAGQLDVKAAVKVLLLGLFFSIGLGVIAHAAGLALWLQWTMAGVGGMLAREVVSMLLKFGAHGDKNAEKIADKIVSKID